MSYQESVSIIIQAMPCSYYPRKASKITYQGSQLFLAAEVKLVEFNYVHSKKATTKVVAHLDLWDQVHVLHCRNMFQLLKAAVPLLTMQR